MMEMVITKGADMMQKIEPWLVPFDYGNIELVPEAPQEIVELREEYLKWREEYQRTRSTWGDY